MFTENVARWRRAKFMWRGGAVARWRGGAVARWRSGANATAGKFWLKKQRGVAVAQIFKMCAGRDGAN